MKFTLGRSSLILGIAAASMLASCTKTKNTINNSQVIATPYALYFSDVNGTLYLTNDTKNYSVVFSTDGKPSRAICTQNQNILWIKPNMYISTNEGKNFNWAFQYITSVSKRDVLGNIFDLNQSMVINIPSWNQSYVTSSDPSGTNFFGIAWNNQGGITGQWVPENYYDTIQMANPGRTTTTSFTQLANGSLFAYDADRVLLLYKTNLQARWRSSPITAGSLPTDTAISYFSLGHLNNTLIAIDNIGNNGAYFSNNSGSTWTQYSGIPAATPLLCVNSPFDSVCLTGTYGKGVYMLNPATNTFYPSNNGLHPNAIVRNIAAKENIYKNETRSRYIFLATDKGIYRSSDLGKNWVLDIKGNYLQVY